MNPWENAIWWITIALTPAVVIKLWASSLFRVYRLLSLYLLSDFLFSVAAKAIPFRSKLYADFYFSAQTTKIVIASFMLVEIYSLALERQPALARFGRGIVGYILLIAGAVPLFGLWVDHTGSAQAHPYIRVFLLFEQTLDATMALFLILISLFLAWFPVRMRRNVIVYIGGFIVWYLSRSALVYVVNRWFHNANIRAGSNIVQMCIELACLSFWLLNLRPEGELRTAIVGHIWNRAEVERLTEQLNSVNNSLERIRRR